jgi:8-oxo-dGTP diphosphatase
MAVIYGEPRVGVGVVVRRGEQVLLGLRQGSHGAGEWALPGGRIDPGETPEQTADRELTEESGLTAVGLRSTGDWTTDLFPAESQHWVTLYTVCEWDGSDPQIMEPHKCVEWRWFSWEDLPSPLFAGVLELRRRYPQLSDI